MLIDSNDNESDKIIPDKEFKGMIVTMFKEHKEERNKLLHNSQNIKAH